jgi:beta-mannosidase
VAAAIHKDINLPGDYDADDWWYQMSFTLPSRSARHYLRFDGLATLAQVWLNGTPILSARNMFVTHRVDVTPLLRDHNELAICFRSLGQALKERRPRPKWKTQLVPDQNLRWFRTTLLGRIPGWTPAITPVGPWGPIGLESIDRVEVQSLRLHTTATSLRLSARVSTRVASARVRIGEREYPLTVDGNDIEGEVAVCAALVAAHARHAAPRALPARSRGGRRMGPGRLRPRGLPRHPARYR